MLPVAPRRSQHPAQPPAGLWPTVRESWRPVRPQANQKSPLRFVWGLGAFSRGFPVLSLQAALIHGAKDHRLLGNPASARPITLSVILQSHVLL